MNAFPIDRSLILRGQPGCAGALEANGVALSTGFAMQRQARPWPPTASQTDLRLAIKQASKCEVQR